ncbi:hypothetical protein GQX74_006466 [Glossina fuscipes]|nr:hypothetical protein GQX74_006466 [Glossina fuscipes]
MKRQRQKKVDSNQIEGANELSTDWEIEKYHQDFEPDDHWQLKRRFIEMHKKNFPEDKLVCLAQVFTNMEFMGCKYPAETMRMVAELSKDVAKNFRAERANRLKRTFVTASDAAEARAKGRKTEPCINIKSNASISNGSNERCDVSNKTDNQLGPLTKTLKNIDLFENLKFGKFVVFLQGGRNCLRESAQRSNMPYTEKDYLDPSGRKGAEIYVNNVFVAGACEDNLKASKASAFKQALEILQKHCYSIKQNPYRDTIKIEKSNNQLICGIVKTQTSIDDKKLDASNKGYKMMKMMGWSGGGLGSQQQGREDPVRQVFTYLFKFDVKTLIYYHSYLLKNDRTGLGNEVSNLDRNYCGQLMRNYRDSDDIRELQFEPTFTKEERALLHEFAQRYGHRSSSYGQHGMRRLIVSKKICTDAILQEILIYKNARYMDHYFIQVPETKYNLFPDFSNKLSL